MNLASTRIKPPTAVDSSPTPPSRFWKFVGRSAATIALPFLIDHEHPQSVEKLWSGVVAFWKGTAILLSLTLLTGGIWMAHSTTASDHTTTVADSARNDTPTADDTATDGQDESQDNDAGDGPSTQQQPLPETVRTLRLPRQDDAVRYLDAYDQLVFVVGDYGPMPLVDSYKGGHIDVPGVILDDGTLGPSEMKPILDWARVITSRRCSPTRLDRYVDASGHLRVEVQGNKVETFDLQSHLPVEEDDEDGCSGPGGCIR